MKRRTTVAGAAILAAGLAGCAMMPDRVDETRGKGAFTAMTYNVRVGLGDENHARGAHGAPEDRRTTGCATETGAKRGAQKNENTPLSAVGVF